ncbi:MAG: glycosyltransferase [Nitrospirota bacterium]|nr:glycosyltransferase [Nitrospirota bacterium]
MHQGHEGGGQPVKWGVCLLSSSYPSPQAPTRGAFVEDIAKGVYSRWPVSVVAPRIYPQDPVAEVRNSLAIKRFSFGSRGVLLKEYGHTPLWLMLRYMLSGVLSCLRVSRGHQLIFAHWVVPAGVIGAVVSWLTGKPLAVYAHGSDINVYADKSALYRLLTRLVLGRARHVFAVSREIHERLEHRWSVPPERLSLIPCGIDTRMFFPAESQSELVSPPRFLFVGDLVPAKGVPELVDAALELWREGMVFRLDVVGDGPLRQEFTARLAEMGADKIITFHGPLPRTEVARLMRRNHCLVLPSHNEGTPLCVMEALSSGIPVLASRVGGIPDLVRDGVDGLLVPPRDVSALSAALHRLASEEGLMKSMGDAARTTGERFSLERRRDQVCQALAAAFPELGD